jgi:hypothetical protein
MQLKTENSLCSGLWAHCRRLRASMIVAMRQAATFIVCLSGLLALPTVCLAQQEFLNPLYTQQNLTTHRLLRGIWEGGLVVPVLSRAWTIILEFQPAENGCYNLTFKALSQEADDADPDKDERTFPLNAEACLVKLGKMVFLDVQAKTATVPATAKTFRLARSTEPNRKNPFSPDLFHIEGSVLGLFVTITPAGGTHNPRTQSEYELRLTPAHWIFRIRISEKKLRLSEYDPDGDVATLSTRELQKLVLKDADEAEGFDKADEFKRKDGGSQ